MKDFDLLYLIVQNVKTMSCALINNEEIEQIGPFPAKEAAIPICKALAKHLEITESEARKEYVVRHMLYMNSRQNKAGIGYPKIMYLHQSGSRLN